MRKILFLLIGVGICLSEGTPIISSSDQDSSFTIEKTWDGNPVEENEKIHFTLKALPNSRDILWSIDAPFYDDPPPGGEPGQPFLGLWDYEVVEVFFLNDKDQYLEVEVSPHGQHIVLLLNGKRNTIRHSLPLVVETLIKGQRWRANATIPGHYFPPKVTKLNAYAIHGVGEERKYLSLYPTDGTTSAPDFHNLSFFKSFDIVAVNPLHKDYTKLSDLWKDALEGRFEHTKRIFKYKITRQWNNFRSKIPPTTATLQGFEGGIEINFTMPINDESYPAESFVVIFENEENEAVKFQFFVDGNYFVEFFKNRKNKLDQEEEIPLDYRVNNRHSRFVKGSALVPPSFFPPKVTLMNMYSLFGVETMLAMTLRAIEIKSGVDFRPNLSNIEHFTPVDFDLLVESNNEYSPLWRKLLNLPTLMTKTMEGANVERNNDNTVIKEALLTTVVSDEKSVPETTQPSEDLGKSIVKQDTISQNPVEVTEGIGREDTTIDPSFIEGETSSQIYEDTSSTHDSKDKGDENDGSTLLNIPIKFVLKNSPGSQTSSKREIYSTKEKEEKFNSNISSKDGEKTENEEITEQEFPPTEGNDNEHTKEVPTESSIDLKTEDPSITPEQPETEVKTKDNQIEENVTVNPATVEEDMLVTTNVEVISQDNENTEESKTDFESTSISTATEPMPESEEGVNSSNVDSVIISPEEDNTEDTTLRNDFPPTFEDSETLLKAPGEGVQKSGLERDKILGQREEHPRRYEEDSGKNEIPITFKITFDSEEGKKGERDNLRPPKLSPEDSFAEDYSLLEEIPDDLVGVEEILPPPHPICFTEGLVPDFYRCQVFYECVLENGKWEVYNWRCKRGSYYDPVKVACIRGYC